MNYSEASKNFIDELTSIVVGQEVTVIKNFKKVDTATVTEVIPDQRSAMYVNVRINFNSSTTSAIYRLRIAFYMNSIKFQDADIATKVDRLLTDFEAIEEEHLAEIKAEQLKKLEEEKAEQLAEKERIKYEEQEKKYKKLCEAQVHKLQTLNTIVIDDEIVDWLKENVTSISAQLPAGAENWFVSRFGTDAVYSVASTKRTSGGYPMKFAPAFSVRLKKNVEVPAALASAVTNGVINNTELVYSMVSDYGFKFGKNK